MNCIWCKNTVVESVPEHIIPEPLGCPENFILKDNEICKACNNNFGHIDQALIDDFDIFLFNNNIPRKKNKKPLITNRGNLLGKHTSYGKTYFINKENHVIQSPFGDKISFFKNRKRNIKAKFFINGERARVNFSTEIGNSQKFVRGIYKIGLEALVFRFGVEEALKDKYDSIRQYVMQGKGKRKMLISISECTNYKNELYNFWLTENKDYVASFRLVYFDFVVDLSTDMSAIENMEKEISKNGWQNIYKIICK